MDLKFYTIDKHYIEFLRTYPKLSNVFDNKENTSSFSRKYLGIVLSINEYKYYVPLSSPKTSDYIVSDGKKSIRKSIVPIIRIIVANAKGDLELSRRSLQRVFKVINLYKNFQRTCPLLQNVSRETITT